MMMKILIVDNEISVRESLRKMITHFDNSLYECFEADSVENGIKKINEINPDIVLLDVELEDGTGIDLLSSLQAINFQLIFITAHNKYAIDAFRFSAIDFLLKPIDIEDLGSALEKAKQQIKNKNLEEQIEVLKQNLNNVSNTEKKIVLKDINSIYFIKVKDIIRCESDGHYTEFYFESNKKIVISKLLKEYEELLKPFGFIRTHHSHLINIDKVLRFDKTNGGTLIMENNDEVPVSHRKKEKILKLLNNI